MKLFLLSDLHLGAACSAWGRHGPRRRDELRKAWTQGVDFVLSPDHGADAVLVAGDLFDRSEPDKEDAEAVMRGLERLAQAGKPVVLLPGIRDGAFTASAFYNRELPEGVTAVTWAETRCLHLGMGNETFRVHCRAPVPGCDGDPLVREDPNRAADTVRDVGLTYALPEALASAARPSPRGLDLLVVGGKPEFASGDADGVTVISPGTPAASRPEQAGDRFWCVAEMTPGGIDVHRVPCAVPGVVSVEVEAGGHDPDDPGSLADHIASRFEGNGLVCLRLTGEAEIPWDSGQLDRVADSVPFAVRIVDDSVLPGDSAADARDRSLRGRFRREILALAREPDAADATVFNRALRLGLKELRRLEECHAD